MATANNVEHRRVQNRNAQERRRHRIKSRLAMLETTNNTLLQTLSHKNTQIDNSLYSHLQACGRPFGIHSPLSFNQHAGPAQEENMFQGHVESKDLMEVVEHPSIHASPHSSTPKGPYDHMHTMFDSKPGYGTATMMDLHELDSAPGSLVAIPEPSLDTIAMGTAIVEPDLPQVHLSQGPESHAIFHSSGDLMPSTTGHPEILHSPRGRPGILTSDITQRSFAVVLDTPVENQSSSPPPQSSRKSNIYLGSNSPSPPHSVVEPPHTPTENPYYYEESSVVDCSTPLHYAVANAHISTVRELIFHGADVSALDKRGCAALHIGAKNQLNNGLLIIRLLIEAGAPLEVRDRRNLTPLQVAAERGNDQIVRLLLALGADVNSRSILDGEEDRS